MLNQKWPSTSTALNKTNTNHHLTKDVAGREMRSVCVESQCLFRQLGCLYSRCHPPVTAGQRHPPICMNEQRKTEHTPTRSRYDHSLNKKLQSELFLGTTYCRTNQHPSRRNRQQLQTGFSWDINSYRVPGNKNKLPESL